MRPMLAELHGEYIEPYGDLEDDALEEIEEGESIGDTASILMGVILDATSDDDFDDVLGMIVDGDDDSDLLDHIDSVLPEMMGADDIIELMGSIRSRRARRRARRKERRSARKSRRRTRRAKRSERRSNRKTKRVERKSLRKSGRSARKSRRAARKRVRRIRRGIRRDKRKAKWEAQEAQSIYTKKAAEQGVAALEAEKAILDSENKKSSFSKLLIPAVAIGAAVLMG